MSFTNNNRRDGMNKLRRKRRRRDKKGTRPYQRSIQQAFLERLEDRQMLAVDALGDLLAVPSDEVTSGSVSLLQNDVNVVTPGYALNYDASLDADNDQTWETYGDDNSNTNLYWKLDSNVTRDGSATVGTHQGAYEFSGGGASMKTLAQTVNAGSISGSASFEIWFQPDSDNDLDVLFESGGTGTGTALLYDGATKSVIFNVDGGSVGAAGKVDSVTFDLDANGVDMNSAIQVVGVIDQDTNDADGVKELDLYVNGQLVGHGQNASNITTWSGGNDSGLGKIGGGSIAEPYNTHPVTNFEGTIGAFRFYRSALSASEVADNYDAVANPLTVNAVEGDSANVGNVVSLPSGATVQVNTDGTFVYDPNGAFGHLSVGETASDTFSYSVVDGNGNTDSDSVTLTVRGSGPIDDAYTISEDSVLEVGSLGIVANDISIASPAADPYMLYDASSDVDLDTKWEESLRRRGSSFDLNLPSSVQRVADSTVSTFPGIEAAYVFSGEGSGTGTLENSSDDFTQGSFTFEMWIQPDAGTDIDNLFESGGTVNGMNIAWDGTTNEIVFTVDTEGHQSQVRSGAVSMDDFVQVAAVIDLETNDTDGRRELELYVNGALVGTADASEISDWTGGNGVGVGEVNDSLAEGIANVTPYEGKMARLALYRRALTPAEVLNNYSHVAYRSTVVSIDSSNTTGTLQQAALQTIGETGSVATDHLGTTVSYSGDYTNPVIIAQPPSYVGSHQSIVRITNVDPINKTFSLKIAEPPHLDGWHAVETIHYTILEAGSYELENGALLEVGTVDTSTTVDPQTGQYAFDPVSLNAGFTERPVVVTQVQSGGSGDFVKTRQRDLAASGFGVALEQWEDASGNSANATIGYIAISQSSGSFATDADNGTTVPYEASLFSLGSTPNTSNADSLFQDVSFSTSFAQPPLLLAGLASFSGSDAAQLRFRNLTATGAEIMVEEDKSRDNEVGHVPEEVALFAIGGSGTFSARPLGGFEYDPTEAFNGLAAGETATDSFTYTNPFGGTATVTLAVQGENDAPTAEANGPYAGSGNAILVSAIGSMDVDDDVLTYDWDLDNDGTPEHSSSDIETNIPWSATQNLSGGGSLGTGVHTITLIVNDGTVSSSDTATLQIGSSGPIAQDDSGETSEDNGIVIDVLANDSDPAGQLLSIVSVTDGSVSGTVTINPDRTITYDPADAFHYLQTGESATETFTYTISNGSQTATATVSVTITGENDAPTEAHMLPNVNIPIGSMMSAIGIDYYFTDVDANDSLTYSIVGNSNPSMFTDVSLNGESLALRYVGVAGYATLTIQAEDEQGATFQMPLNIAIQPGFTSTVVSGLINDVTVEEDSPNERLDLTAALGGQFTQNDGLLFTLTQNTDTATVNSYIEGEELVLNFPPNAFGQSDITIWTDDNDSATDPIETSFTVTVTPVADPPIALDDALSLNEDEVSTDLSTLALANDSDPDGDILENFTILTGPTNGTIDPSTFVYTPNVNFSGTDTITYSVSDPSGLTDTATISITVMNEIDPPVAINDIVTVSEDSTGNVIDVLANDYDPDGDTLTITGSTAAQFGTLVLNDAGTPNDPSDDYFTYTPNANFTGTDLATYTIADPGGLTDTATITINVTDVNDAPTAIADNITIDEDTVSDLDVLANDDAGVDLDDIFSLVSVTTPTHGTVSIVQNADGVDVIRYTPDENYFGTDTFSYTMQDRPGADAITSTATVTLTINPINDAPVAVPDVRLYTDPSAPLSIDVLTNDHDIDTGDVITLSNVQSPSDEGGTVTIDNGTVLYTPSAGFSGSDTFTYTISDQSGATATATVHLHATNTPPTGTSDTYSVSHGRTLLVDASDGVLRNDVSWDGDPLWALLDTNSTHPPQARFTLNSDGSFEYSPPNNTFIGTETFSYFATDTLDNSDPIVVTIEVTNTDPIVQDDQYTVARNSVLSVPHPGVLANDLDVDGDLLSVTVAAGPSNGTLQFTPAGPDGLLGGFDYTPDPGFVGTDTFTYSTTDAVAGTQTATVTIVVENDAPIAEADFYETNSNQQLVTASGSLLRNDYDLNDQLLTVAPIAGETSIAAQHGQLTVQADGGFAYTPDAGFVGRDRFQYRAFDGDAYSEPVDVLIEVSNTAPIVQDLWLQVQHDSQLVIDIQNDILSNVIDLENTTFSVEIMSSPRHGVAAIDSSVQQITYDPNAEHTGVDSIGFRVFDGQAYSRVAMVYIDIVNQEPFAVSDFLTATSNETLRVDAPGLLQNDLKYDNDNITITIVTAPTYGTIHNLTDDGAFEYEPQAGFVGSDVFSYRIDDGVSSATSTVSLQVVGPTEDSEPNISLGVITNPDVYSVSHSGQLSIGYSQGVLANDFQQGRHWLDVSLVNGPTSGTLDLNSNGSFSYSPSAGASAPSTVTFSYVASDGDPTLPSGQSPATSSPTTVTINITNQAPTLSDLTESTHFRSDITIPVGTVLDRADDADSDDLSIYSWGTASFGSVSQDYEGNLTYHPYGSYVGQDSFDVRVTDGLEASNVATVHVNLTNDAPDLPMQRDYIIEHRTELAGNVLDLASDPNGDPISATVVSSTTNGTLSVTENTGDFTYTPNDDFAGVDEFTVRADDAGSEGAEMLVRIEVLNIAPDVFSQEYYVHHRDVLTSQYDAWDADGDSISRTSPIGPFVQTQYGTLSLGSLGSPAFTYTPSSGTLGTDTVSVTVTDGIEPSEPGVLTIHITNTKPEAGDAHFRIRPNGQVGDLLGAAVAHSWDANNDPLTASVEANSSLQHGTLEISGSSVRYVSNGTVGTDTIDYMVTDGAESDTGTLTIRVGNHAPIATDQFIGFHHNREYVHDEQNKPYGKATFDLNGSVPAAVDPDGDPISYTLVDAPGGVTLSGSVITYEPAPGSLDPVTVTFRASDGFEYDEATLTITPNNVAPYAADDHYSIPKGDAIYFSASDFLQNDFDPDADALVIRNITSPQLGTFVGSLSAGTLKYESGGTGTDHFTYQLFDGAELSEPATVSISVVNTKPWGSDRSLYVSGSSLVSASIDTFAWDLEGNDLVAEVVSPPGHGTATAGKYGVSYRPDSADGPDDSFTVRVSDGFQYSENITFAVERVKPPETDLGDVPVLVTPTMDYPDLVPHPPELTDYFQFSQDPIVATLSDFPPRQYVGDENCDGGFSWMGGGNVVLSGMTSCSLNRNGPFPSNLLNGISGTYDNPVVGASVSGGSLGSLSLDANYTGYYEPYDPLSFVQSGGDTFTITADFQDGTTESATFTISPVLMDRFFEVSASVTYLGPDNATAYVRNQAEDAYAWFEGLDTVHYVGTADTQVVNAGPNLHVHGGANWLSIGTENLLSDIDTNGHLSLYVENSTQDIHAASADIFVSETIGNIDVSGTLELDSHANAVIGDVQAGEIDSLDVDTAGTITTTGDAEYLALESYGTLTIGGVLEELRDDDDLTGSVTAAAIGGIYVDGAIWGSVYASGNIGGIGTAAEISSSATIAAGGNIEDIYVGSTWGTSDLSGSVTAGGDIGGITAANIHGTISAGGSIEDIDAFLGNIPEPPRQGTLTGSITAGGSINTIWAGDVSGSVQAGERIGDVTILGDLTGQIETEHSYIDTINVSGSVGSEAEDGAIVSGDDIYSVRVSGEMNGNITAAQDIYGVAVASLLYGDITATNGDIFFAAFGTVDADASVTAGSSIQHVVVDGDGLLGTITAENDIRLIEGDDAPIGGTIISNTGNIYEVKSGVSISGATITATTGSIGTILTDHWLTYVSPGPIDATISAKGNIKEIISDDAITGSITTTDGWIGTVRAWGGDIGADVTVGSTLYGLYATGSLTGNVTAQNDIRDFYVDDDASGNIEATSGKIIDMVVRGNLSGDVTAGDEIYELSVTDNASGNITSTSGGIRWLTVSKDLSGDVTALSDIRKIFAGEDITGTLESTNGYIGDIAADRGDILSPKITAGSDIGHIRAPARWGSDKGTIDVDEITSGGKISGIHAARSIVVSAQANGSIGPIDAGISVTGPIESGRNIAWITARTGGIVGPITADKHVGPVTAELGISGDISAGANTAAITSKTESVGSNISATGDIGNVTAAKHISGTLTAEGNIGDISAGIAGIGDVGGIISAGANIYAIHAEGANLYDHDWKWSETGSANAGAISTWMRNTTGPTGYPMPQPPVPPVPGAGGNILQSVTAGGGIGGVFAKGTIHQNLTAEDGVLYEVIAVGDILGDASSTEGNLNLTTYGVLDGSIDVVGTLHAQAFTSIDGDLESSSGRIYAETWGDLSGDVTAKYYLEIVARTGVDSQIESEEGVANVISYGEIRGSITGMKRANAVTPRDLYADMYAGPPTDATNQPPGFRANIQATASRIQSPIMRAFGDIHVHALDYQRSRRIEAEGHVYIWSWGDIIIDDRILADRYIHLTAQKDIDIKSIAVSAMDIVAQGANVNGRFRTILSESDQQYGDRTRDVSIVAWTSADVDVDSLRYASLYSAGTATGTLKGATGVNVTTFGEMSADTFSGNKTNIQSWSSITGDITSDRDAHVFAYGDIDGTITVGEEGVPGDWGNGANVVSWQSINGPITASGHVNVQARNGINANILAGGYAHVDSHNTIDADIMAGSPQFAFGSTSAPGTEIEPLEARVTALSTINSNVTAGGPVGVQSGGNITGDMTSEDGNVGIVALDDGNYTGNITSGGDVAITVAGSIENVEIDAGKSVLLASHVDINNVTINRAQNEVKVSADGTISKLVVDAAKTIAIGTIGGISGGSTASYDTTLVASHNISVVSHAGASFQATSSAGTVTARALETLSADLDGFAGVSATAYGSGANVTADSRSGSITLSSGGTLETTANANANIKTFSLEDVSGTFETMAGDVIISTLTSANDLTVNAHGDTVVVAATDVSGTIDARAGTASVLSQGSPESESSETEGDTTSAGPGGDVSATIKGYKGANVTSLGGSITGEITSARGNVVAQAFDTITKDVDAGKKARVFAIGTIEGKVDARGTATVTSRDTISGDVTSTHGSARVWGGQTVSGDVDARVSARVRSSEGSVTGDIVADSGTADVGATVDVTGTVLGDLAAHVRALGSISATVDATSGSVIARALGGDISGALTAPQDVKAFTSGSLSGEVDAGRNADVVAFGSLAAAVNAGQDVQTETHQSVDEAITGGRNATIFAFGDVQSDVTATSGVAAIESWGGVTSNVTAGRSAYVQSSSDANVQITAGENASVRSYATATVDITSANAYSWAVGSTDATIDTTENATIISLDNASVTGNAGGDAYVWSFGPATTTLSTDQDATIVALDRLTANLTTGGDAFTLAIGNSNVTTDAGGAAFTASWGNADVSLDGNDSAFVWANGPVTGRIDSAAGSAGAVAIGSADLQMAAEGSAYVFATGALTTTLSGEDAFLWSGGNVTGQATADANVVVLGFGNVNLNATSGRDALIYTVGSISGTYSVGRDLAMLAHGSINTISDVGRDLSWVQATGDLIGTYEVVRHVVDVHINGTTEVGLFTDSPESTIVSFVSVGPILGYLEAGSEITSLRSGAAISALVITPEILELIEFDSTVAPSQYLVTPPTSPVADIAADAAAAYQDLLTVRQEGASKIAVVTQKHADEKTTIQAKLADVRSDVEDRRIAIADELSAELAEAITKDNQTFAARRAEAAIENEKARTDFESDKAEAEQERTEDIATGNQNYQDRQQDIADARDQANTIFVTTIQPERNAAFSDMQDRQFHALNWWDSELIQIGDAIDDALNYSQYFERAWWGSQWQKVKDGFLGRAGDVYQRAKDQGESELWALYQGTAYQFISNFPGEADAIAQATGVWTYDTLGITGIYRGITGEDIISSERYYGGARAFQGVMGTIQLVTTVMSGVKALQTFKGACHGYIFRRCFVKDIQTLALENADGTTITVADNGLFENMTLLEGIAVGCGVLTVAGVLIGERHRRRSKRRREEVERDNFFQHFGEGVRHFFLPKPELSLAQYADKCHDAIFGSDGEHWLTEPGIG